MLPLPFMEGWGSSLLRVMDGFCMPSSAFESTVRVFWISASGGVLKVSDFWAGGSPSLSSC